MAVIYRHIEKKDNKAIAELIRTVFREFKIDRPGTVYFDPTTDDLFTLFSRKGSEYWIVEENSVDHRGMWSIFNSRTAGRMCRTCQAISFSGPEGKRFGAKADGKNI